MKNRLLWQLFSFSLPKHPCCLRAAASVMSMTTASAAEESSANLSSWSSRWTDMRIGWHIGNVNEALQLHGDALLTPSEACAATAHGNARVLVSLCGKTVDMAFLAQHDKVGQVIGVDGIATALEQFAREQPDLQVEAVEATGSYQTWKGKKITLLKGDFFELTPEATGGKVDAIVDRASLVAIEPAMRAKYVEIMGQVLAPGGKILLIVVEHDNKTGPPYSFQPADVEALYRSLEWVESITQLNPDGPGKDETGNSGMGSRWYMIQAK